MINVNRQAKLTIELVGQDNTPVIIIDDYVEDLAGISAEAVQHGGFKPDEVTKYPGIRSHIPKGLVVSYLKPLIETLYRVYKFPESFNPTPIDNYFSLITAQPNEISAMQSWPHFDTPNPNLIAVIHYLDKGSHGGTGFFQHKKSGLDRIDEKSQHDYFQYASDYFQPLDSQTFSYCNEKHSEFTCYKKIDYKPNRLIIFPGQLLHSTLVNIDTDINDNPASGRLTANMFLIFK